MAAKDMYKQPDYLAQRDRLPAPDFLLDWYLKVRKESDDWEVPVKDRTWRASSLGDCPRVQTLVRRGLEPFRVFDAKTLRTFAWGDFIHDWVKGMYRDLGLTIVEEPLLVDEARNVKGHADLVFTIDPLALPPTADERRTEMRLRLAADLLPLWGQYGDDDMGHAGDFLPDEPYGMELKSVHSNAIKRVFNEGPYVHHRSQVGIYKAMSQTTGTVDALSGVIDMKEVDRWFITYIGKDSVGLLTFEVEDSWVETALSTLELLNRSWRAGVLPACSCAGWMVGYCTFNEGDTCCGRNLKGRLAKQLRKVGV